LKRIVRDLPRGVELWVGGRGAAAFEPLIGTRGLLLKDLDEYMAQLSRLGTNRT
jgi:hypothetical protein